MATSPASPSPASGPSALVQNYGRQDVRFVRGRGCELTDDQGRRYLDAFAGVAVSVLGHGHPALVEAIARQAGELLHTSNHYGIPKQEELATAIVGAAFPGRVLFCNSGTEANEAAYKVARLWGNQVHAGGKRRMVACLGGFHGRTLAALSLTANPAYREPFAPMPPTDFIPFGDAAAMAAALSGGDVAAVFLEPIQGEGGVNTPPPGYLAAARELCTRHGALLVVDEIQTGVGRTGRFFCHQHEGIVPDIMTMAKGLGGGVPIGAVLFSEPLAALLVPGLHGTTFGGNHLACAAGLVVMREVGKPGFLARVAARGEQLRQGLASLFGPGHEVRGRGLLLGVQLSAPPAALVKAALAEGLVVGPSGNNTLRLAPPLVISETEVSDLLARLAKALKRLT